MDQHQRDTSTFESEDGDHHIQSASNSTPTLPPAHVEPTTNPWHSLFVKFEIAVLLWFFTFFVLLVAGSSTTNSLASVKILAKPTRSDMTEKVKTLIDTNNTDAIVRFVEDGQQTMSIKLDEFSQQASTVNVLSNLSWFFAPIPVVNAVTATAYAKKVYDLRTVTKDLMKP